MIYRYLNRVDPRSLRLVLIGMWSLVATIVAVYYLKPAYGEWSQISVTRSHLEDIVANDGQLEREITDQQQTITQLKERLQGDSESLPLKQMESFIIGRLQKISWDNKIELVSVKPSVATRVLSFDEIAFEVEISGPYQSVYAWLRELAHDLGFILVKKFGITPVASKQTAEKLRMTLTMVFYRTAAG